jgi:hypothetical protein
MFYCNAVSSKLNSNFNDLFNTTIQTTTNIPSPSLSSSSSNSSSPLKETTFRQTKLQKLDFNNINVQQSPTNTTNKLMASIYYNNDNQSRESTTCLKRKISNTDFDDTIENIPNNKITNVNNNNSSSSSSSSTIHSNFHVISTKPTETQYINSKSILYIYYKFDLATAIDDHFTKSFNNNKNNVKSCKILQLGKNKKSYLTKQTNYKQNQSNHNNYWASSDTLKPNTTTTTTPDVYTWPYYSHHAYTNSTPSSTTSSHNTPSNSSHVQDSWNRAAVDMAASLYSNPHYASSLTNIHHHHHHQYNSLLTNNVTNNSNHLYNQPTTAADLLSTLTNRNETTTTRNDISLLTQKYTKNINQDGQSTTSATTSSSNSFMAPTYNFTATNLQQNETSLEPYHTDTSSSSTQYGCNNDSNNFIDYTANPNVSKGAAAAALVAANQYLSASLNTTNSGYQHRYHHHHPQYLNHFDLTKNSIQDCRRATNHYAHLSTHLPYSGI